MVRCTSAAIASSAHTNRLAARLIDSSSWIPAEEFEALNAASVGVIEVIAESRG